MRKKVSVKNILFLLFGPMLSAISLCAFTIPNKLVGGGVTGIGTLLFYALGIQPSLTNAVINLLLLLLAILLLGWRFVGKTALGAGLMSLYLEIFSFLPALTDDLFLAVVIGAALDGVGIGMTLAAGGSTGGTDIIGRLFQCKWPEFPIGRMLLLVNGAIVCMSFFVFAEVDLFLFSLLLLFGANMAVDLLINLLNASKFAFLVTDRGEEVARALMEKNNRGVTMLEAKGAYTGNDKTVLLCAMKDSEAGRLQEIVTAIDPGAFVIFTESKKILGNGFHLYR